MKKRLDAEGFTLIELLAVITIMGILMMAAIPAISRTIENSRKDTFLNTVGNYVSSAKTMWAADNLSCTYGGKAYSSSAVDPGTYYIEINTADDSTPNLLEQGGKSAWGNRDMKGYIKVVVASSKVSFYPIVSDGVHGVNTNAVASPKADSAIVRGDLAMSGQAYPTNPASGTAIKCVEQ